MPRAIAKCSQLLLLRQNTFWGVLWFCSSECPELKLMWFWSFLFVLLVVNRHVRSVWWALFQCVLFDSFYFITTSCNSIEDRARRTAFSIACFPTDNCFEAFAIASAYSRFLYYWLWRSPRSLPCFGNWTMIFDLSLSFGTYRGALHFLVILQPFKTFRTECMTAFQNNALLPNVADTASEPFVDQRRRRWWW